MAQRLEGGPALGAVGQLGGSSHRLEMRFLKAALHFCVRQLHWRPDIVVGDMGYSDMQPRREIRQRWSVAVLTRVHNNCCGWNPEGRIGSIRRAYPPGNYRAYRKATGEIVPLAGPTITFWRDSNQNKLVMTWLDGYQLFSSDKVAGPFEPVANVTTGASISLTDPQRFFLLRPKQ